MTQQKSKMNIRLLVLSVTLNLISFGSVCLFSLLARADFSLGINQVNDVTHIEVPNIGPNEYQLNQKGDKVELLVSGLNPKSAEKLTRYSDQHIKKITITKSNSLDKDIITVTLAGKKTQVFDYLTDSPSALSIDFYIDEKSPDSNDREDSKSSVRKTANNEDAPEKVAKASSSVADRKPSSDEFLQSTPFIEIVKVGSDGRKAVKPVRTRKEFLEEVKSILDFDLSRVLFKSDSIIESRGKIFIKFPVLINQNSQLTEIVKKKVYYEVADSDDDETKKMLAAKKFFTQNDLKSFLRSKEAFIKNYPETKYMEMLMFMEADALYDLSRSEKSKILLQQSLNIYDAVVSKYPNSPLAERTLLFTAAIRMEMEEYLGAIRNLKAYVKKYESSPLRDNMEIFLAHCLLRVHENDDAMKIFEKLIASGDPEVKRQATYELGDAYFEKKEYKKAIDFYNAAVEAFPENKKNFPNAFFNKAESEFVDERYKDSLETFKNFLTLFPQHPYAHYAWTRIGEIFEIAQEDFKGAEGYYRESIFRFQNTPGGAIARIHLLSHQIATAEARRLPILLSDLRGLEKQVALPQADEFVAFNVSDAYFNRGNYKEATDELIGFFKKVKIPTYADKFHRRIGRGISFQMREKLAQGKTEAAFKVLESYDPLWIKKSERLDFTYLKGVGYEATNAHKRALKEYKSFVDKFKVLASPEEIVVVEKLPAIDEVYMRMAKCAFALKDLAAAREYMAKADVSKISPERQDPSYLMQARIAEAGGQLDSAEGYLKEIKKDSPESLAFKIHILEKNKKYAEAIALTDNYLEKNKLSAADRFPILRKKLGLMENIAVDKKYYEFSNRLFEEYKTTKFDFDAEKYKLGLHFSEQGKNKESEEVWSTIQDGTMWKKLAKESSTEKKWNSTYKKYIERIPAMAEGKEEKK
jgi:tetratricopeptide (TPR) repeat protein